MALECEPFEDPHARISLRENEVQAPRGSAKITIGEEPGDSKYSPG